VLKRASFWLAMALSICAIGGLATISLAATHKKKVSHSLKLPKAAKPLLKGCLAHNGSLKHRRSQNKNYTKHKELLALHFLEKYSKTRYTTSLANCERNLAKTLHVKLPKKHNKKKNNKKKK